MRKFAYFLAALGIGILVLACRTTELISNAEAPQAAVNVTEEATRILRPTHIPFTSQAPTESAAVPPPAKPPTKEPPTAEAPTAAPPTDAPPPPTDVPSPAPPTKRPPTSVPTTAFTDTPSGPTPTPGPNQCGQEYCIVFKGCQPDGNIVVEGTVYNNGAPESGVVARAALSEGAFGVVEFKSGTDRVNPGKPDPNHPGEYILQIVPGSAREGDWWIFLVDVPRGTRVISDAKLIHTDADVTGSSCQHAFIDFVHS